MPNIKLTPRQKEIIRKLREGYIITHNDRNFLITKISPTDNDIIRWPVWNKMIEQGLIFQEFGWPFEYKLTELGKTLQL